MKKTTLYLLIIVLAISAPAFSQKKERAIIEGRVFNIKNNEPIEFASIAVWGTTIGAISDIDGKFTFLNLKPGYIELRVTAVGFETYVSEQILVTNANKVFIDIPLQESVQEIEAVVVKTSVFRREIESPVSLRNIGIKEIEKNPGGNRDISRVLQSFPGVASTPSFRNDVIVRGGGSSENRFYLDGVEIPNLNHFATQGASGGPVGIINVDFVREVNFYSGAFPANRGNALSSVIDFRQIDGNKEKLKTRASVGASDLALALDGPLSDSTTFVFSVRRSYLQFLFSALGLPFLPTYNDFQFKTRTIIDGKNEISVIGLGAYDQNKLNLAANETERQRYILSYLPDNDQWNYTLGIVYRHYRENSYDTWVMSRNMLNNTQIKYFNNIEADTNKILDYTSFEAENKFRYERNAQINGGYKLIAGTGLEYARYYNSTYRKLKTSTDSYESNMDFVKWSIFGQISKAYFEKSLSLSMGLRADGVNYSPEMANMLDQVSPRLSASYVLHPKVNLNASAGRFYQLPPYTTLGFRNSSGELVNKKNNLKYIVAEHFVSGFDYMPNPNSKISIEGFYKNYSNYPFSVADSIAVASKGADFGTYGDEEVVSTGKGRAYGAEILVQSRDFMGFNVTVSYTLVRSEFRNYSGIYVPSAWDNKHLLNILLRKEFRSNWDIGLKWRFVGGSPYTPADLKTSSLVSAWNVRNQTYPDYSRFNSERLKAFHQLDLRIDKEYFFERWSLIAYIDIQNIYNFKSDSPPVYLADYSIPIINDPEPRYRLKILENDGGGTILPTMGVIVQF